MADRRVAPLAHCTSQSLGPCRSVGRALPANPADTQAHGCGQIGELLRHRGIALWKVPEGHLFTARCGSTGGTSCLGAAVGSCARGSSRPHPRAWQPQKTVQRGSRRALCSAGHYPGWVGGWVGPRRPAFRRVVVSFVPPTPPLDVPQPPPPPPPV